ncbi:hypothetical protein K2W90_02760 [Candidatus Babeliales bacterium]|nr:hypothetical protein [Candidatus Babeliales bacterium]
MKIIRLITSAYALLVLLFFASCLNKRPKIAIEAPKASDQKTTSTHAMVVFVHGTMLPLPNVSASFSSLKQSLSRGRHTNKSWYQLYLDQLKTKSVYHYQPLGAEGLHQIVDQPAACIAASMFTELLPNSCSCYTFGWNGRLDQTNRQQAAEKLYLQLLAEVENLQKKFENVELLLIGHSHGGNVLLNLAQAEETHKKNLSIDKLVLLGTPIQTETAHYVAAPCFKKVYNFYSTGDKIQKLDRLSTSKKSHRKLQHHNKLIQIKLLCGKKKPGHADLFMFGASGNWLYSNRLAIEPFPVFVFLPIILPVLDTQYATAPSILLTIEKDGHGLRFLFSNQKHSYATTLNASLLKKYRKQIRNL